MNQIEQQWQAYRFKVVPLDASNYQVIESRRAYFAGAGAIVKTLQGINITASPALDRELDDLRREVEIFRAEVSAGRA